MTACCKHNPCPGKPNWFLGRFMTRPWRCPQCGQFWVTKGTYLWGEWNGYEWVRVDPRDRTDRD
jgi:hypothetical protein